MTESLRASYEAAPYESRAITATHIDNLFTMARLHRLRPATPANCRVLELGCASGGNIIPMAIEFPGSHFVGVDLAPGHIDLGRRGVAELGLSNVELHAMSIADVDDSFGTFDYILCHGVYSWVPPQIQDATLRICARNLSPAGIAYVSYNTYPGWHTRMSLRQMLTWNDDPSLPPAARVARARAFADKLANSASPTTLHGSSLRQEAMTLRSQRDSIVLHEQLEPFNSPLLFSEFVGRAAAHGLQYVSESSLGETRNAVASLLGGRTPEDADLLGSEQYADFILGRTFRRSLLAHSAADVRRELDIEVLKASRLRVRATPVPPSAKDLERSKSAESFRSPENATITTDDPWLIAAMHVLGGALPEALAFSDMMPAVRERMKGLPTEGLADAEDHLATGLLRYAAAGLVSFRSSAQRIARSLAERPVATPAARWQAPYSEYVTNLLHASVPVSALDRLILPSLDGTRDRSQLVAIVEKATADGTFVPDADRAGAPVEMAVEEALDGLLRSLVLVGS